MVDEPSVDGLRELELPLYRRVRASNGAVDTISLRNGSGGVFATPADCGYDGDVVVTTLGMVCASVELRSYFGTETLTDVYAMITRINPDTGYNGYGPTYGGADPADVYPGPGAPTDLGGGLWHYGDVAPGEAKEVTWRFQYAGGAYRFSGEIRAAFPELRNGADDNGDGRIDEEPFANGETCTDASECYGGACNAGLCATATGVTVDGCTDSGANNYDSSATSDDGSCTYDVDFSVDMRCSGLDTSSGLEIRSNASDGQPAGSSAFASMGALTETDGVWTGTLSFPAGDWEWKAKISGDDSTGWEDSISNRAITAAAGASATVVYDDFGGGTCTPGCNDPDFVEYDAAANFDDGSCATAHVDGCMEAGNINYNASATRDPSDACARIGFCQMQYPTSVTLSPGDTESFYGRVYVAGCTDGAAQCVGVQAEAGFGDPSVDPSASPSSYTWASASYNAGHTSDNNDEYDASLPRLLLAATPTGSASRSTPARPGPTATPTAATTPRTAASPSRSSAR